MEPEEYPHAVQTETVGKVRYRWYTTVEDAKQASFVAVMNDLVACSRGYNTGYEVPGTIESRDGQYRVTCPMV